MFWFVDIAHKANGNEKEGLAANPHYCPKSVLSWVMFRVALHNMKMIRRKGTTLSKKELKRSVEMSNSLLDRSAEYDEDGMGAKKLIPPYRADLMKKYGKHFK
jgi:hypothetical protein